MSTPAQSRNRRGQGERLRGALLTAAAELLSDDPDIEHLSVRAVTARAGVTHTAMYLHFADKDALIQAVKVRCFEELSAVLAAAAGERPNGPVDQLRAASEAYLRFAAQHPGHYAVMFHTLRPQLTDAPEEVRTTGMRGFNQLVELAAAAVGERDAYDAATNLWLALHGRASIRRSMPWFPMSDDTSYVRDQVDALIRPRSSAP